MKLDRRNIVIGASAALMASQVKGFAQWPQSDSGRPFQQIRDGGCAVSASSSVHFLSDIHYEEGIEDKTGHWSELLGRGSGLDKHLGTKTSIAFYDDAGALNAYALPVDLLDGRPNYDGTIFFGKALLKKFAYQRGYWSSELTAVLAHEYGHIRQFKSRISLGFPQQELHADFLSGWFIGVMHADIMKNYHNASPERLTELVNIDAAARMFSALGNAKFNTLEFHGTTAQREAALRAGYSVGLDTSDWHSAVNEGLKYVQTI